MRLWLFLLTMAVLGFGLFLISCDDDDDDCDCDCQDGENCDDDASDDDTSADDDAAGDDDALGTTPGAQECLDALKEPMQTCKSGCFDYEEKCEQYHCLYDCFHTMFTGAVACADQFPELENMKDYWQCHADCDSAYTQCLEPLDECDLDIYLACIDELQMCEADCTTDSLVPAE